MVAVNHGSVVKDLPRWQEIGANCHDSACRRIDFPADRSILDHCLACHVRHYGISIAGGSFFVLAPMLVPLHGWLVPELGIIAGLFAWSPRLTRRLVG
jgi:hypothetical protein